ncbi:uncharacterized protein MELLADRAFT_110375 [Melampsora larici-populina 98AG31]|uniref:Uncharacterized protein n=1 Tax=Melampsora larici-populina (strain 98AG31 / pathotype 3-4-7) TaxID=747676 RepID=F4RZL1_MELLP|nr:uncharacterized protein MELLADRAFT_110375 [Melampsora larici-populina 98AG31]EGG02022.1 hypothetical protein MELLADRAFT_110375 [Melampsora larici-populina 98AG31]
MNSSTNPSNQPNLIIHSLPNQKPRSSSSHSLKTSNSNQPNRLLNLPNHLFKLKLKSNHHQTEDQRLQEKEDQRSLHTAVSQLGSNYETAQSQNDHQIQPSSNQLWPILPKPFVYPQSNQNDQFFHPNSIQSTSNLQILKQDIPLSTSDWTTSLGIDLNPKIKHSTSTSTSSSKSSTSFHQLSPRSNHFKLNKSKHKSTSQHKRKSSVYKSNSVYTTYTTSNPSHRTPKQLIIQNSSRPNTGSSTLTHSSASTNRLRKTPSSGFSPIISSNQPSIPSKRIIKKRLPNPRHESNTTNSTSTKDFSGTSNSFQISLEKHESLGLGGKLGVQLRYQNAMANQHPISHLDRSSSLSPLSNQRSDAFEHHTPEAGPSDYWKRDHQHIGQQEKLDRHRDRYRDLTSPGSNVNLSKRSKKKQTPSHSPSWEYQVTEQLLIQSQSHTPRKDNLSPKSSPYHSLKSALSFETSPRLSPSLTMLSNRILSSPGSISETTDTRPISTPSRVGTMVSIFSEWSRGRQTSMGLDRRRGSDQLEPNSIRLSSLRSHEILSNRSSLNALDIQFDSNCKETLVSVVGSDESEEIHSSRAFLSSVGSKERVNQRSVTQLRRDVQKDYFSRNEQEEQGQPNDLTHHDQAGLLLSFLPSPSDQGFSPLPSLSPGLHSEPDEEDEDQSSSLSWYDATDQVNIMDSFSTTNPIERLSDELNEPKPIGYNPRHSQPTQSQMKWIKPAKSAAIVYETSHPSESSHHHFSSSLNQYQFFKTTPLLLGSNTISVDHKKTYSTPSMKLNQFKLKLPFPVEKIKSHGIFGGNDDPNFLSGSSLNKKGWKKSGSRSRVKRAVSDPQGVAWLGSEDGSFGNRRSDRHGHQQHPRKVFSGGFEGWKFRAPLRIRDDEDDDQEELMDVQDLIELDPIPNQPQVSHQEHQKANQTVRLDRNHSMEIRIDSQPIRAHQSRSSISTPTNSSRISNRFVKSVALVPFNGWCFVFGFVFFPAWYLGSFYPRLNSLSSSKPNPKRVSLNLIRPSVEQEEEPVGVGRGGPLSGWPPRRTTPSDSDRSVSDLTRWSTGEENRVPNFGDQDGTEMRMLGGFWSEVVPRIDVEVALAMDGPVWELERAVHTWRLRCRVMSVLFPLVFIPSLVVSGIMVKKM